MRNHIIQLKTGLKRNPAFEQKRLASYSTNVGLNVVMTAPTVVSARL